MGSPGEKCLPAGSLHALDTKILHKPMYLIPGILVCKGPAGMSISTVPRRSSRRGCGLGLGLASGGRIAARGWAMGFGGLQKLRDC